jgi:uncharacterized protein (DUF1778 family)
MSDSQLSKKKSSRITATVPAHVRATIEEAAALRGISVGAFVAEAAARTAEQVIEKEQLIELSREDAQMIMAPLENPPPPNAALLEAAEFHKRLTGG